jgi:hypothetical protein
VLTDAAAKCGIQKYWSMKRLRCAMSPLIFHFELVLYHFEEHRLRMFEIRVPRKIFGPKREDMAGS